MWVQVQSKLSLSESQLSEQAYRHAGRTVLYMSLCLITNMGTSNAIQCTCNAVIRHGRHWLVQPSRVQTRQDIQTLAGRPLPKRCSDNWGSTKKVQPVSDYSSRMQANRHKINEHYLSGLVQTATKKLVFQGWQTQDLHTSAQPYTVAQAIQRHVSLQGWVQG